MGMKIASWWKGIKLASDNATIAWVMSCPGLISSISATGRKYRSHTQWPATKAFKLDRSNDQKTWYEVWNEATPTAAATWQAVTKAGQAITPNMAFVGLFCSGRMPAVADIQAMAEILTCTVAFVSGNLPVGTLLGEKTNYLLDVVITNEAFRRCDPVDLSDAVGCSDGCGWRGIYGHLRGCECPFRAEPGR